MKKATPFAVLRIQDVIDFQYQSHLREGQTPSRLELGRTEDELLLAAFKNRPVHEARLQGSTTLHGFDYNRMRISVTKDLTGVKVS